MGAPAKKGQFFGVNGIHPIDRLIATRYLKKSSIRVSLGIECLKPGGKTCTRNFVFRADYQNIKKKCPCLEQKRKEFKIDASTLAVNNLGGLGPDNKKEKETATRMLGKIRTAVISTLLSLWPLANLTNP